MLKESDIFCGPKEREIRHGVISVMVTGDKIYMVCHKESEKTPEGSWGLPSETITVLSDNKGKLQRETVISAWRRGFHEELNFNLAAIHTTCLAPNYNYFFNLKTGLPFDPDARGIVTVSHIENEELLPIGLIDSPEISFACFMTIDDVINGDYVARPSPNPRDVIGGLKYGGVFDRMGKDKQWKRR